VLVFWWFCVLSQRQRQRLRRYRCLYCLRLRDRPMLPLRHLSHPNGRLGAFLLLLLVQLLLVDLLLVEIHCSSWLLLVLHEDGYLLHFLASTWRYYHIAIARGNETVTLIQLQSRFSRRCRQVLLVRRARRLLKVRVDPCGLYPVLRRLLWLRSLLPHQFAHLHRVN
jgi:hypothetical protein